MVFDVSKIRLLTIICRLIRIELLGLLEAHI